MTPERLEAAREVLEARDTPSRWRWIRHHDCHEDYSCSCSAQGVEPNEDCCMHGSGPWPPRCCLCGRFLPHDIREQRRKENQPWNDVSEVNESDPS
jgi:CO dehydrogenase/acetyl-CoA synthase beta subunit